MGSVTAKDKKTPTNSVNITIDSNKGRLSEDEINRIVADAEKYKAADEEKIKLIQAKNELENMAYSMRNNLDKVSKEEEKEKNMKQRKKRLKRFGIQLFLHLMDKDKDKHKV